MKKKWLNLMLLLLFYLFFISYLSAESSLLKLYKKGEIILESDLSYGKNVKWSKVFEDYKNSLGKTKKMAIADDGSIFISNSSSWNVYEFDPSGQYIKAFGKKGTKNGLFFRRPEIFDILPNKMPIVKGWHGGLYIFNSEGIFQRSIKLDYIERDVIALTDNKIVISGFVVYSNKRIKNRVAIMDLQTGKEKEIFTIFKDLKKNTVSVEVKYKTKLKSGLDKDHKGLVSCGFPYNHINVYINKIDGKNIMIGVDNSPILSIFSPEGKLLKHIDLKTKRLPISEDDKNEYLSSLKKSKNKYNINKKLLDAIKEKKSFFGKNMPYYYNIMVDSENNILVFPYGKAENGRWFQVYSQKGELISETKMKINDYQIKLNPRSKSMAFFNGCIYGLFEKKGVKGGPLRLVKMNIK